MGSNIDRRNLDYIDTLFKEYKKNPQSVLPDWKLFFDGVEFSQTLDQGSFSQKELGVYDLINTYREDGHLKARLDPLQIQKPATEIFDLSRFDLDESDRKQSFKIFSLLQRNFKSLSEMLHFLEKTYCSTLALHVGGCAPKIRHWFFREFEQNSLELSSEKKKQILSQLTCEEAFEKFIHNRFIGAKRFSIEGADSLIPMLDHLVEKGSSIGVQELIMGMAHRGRLNVLVNFMDQSHDIIFSQFEGEAFTNMDFTGDVKYHIGFSCEKRLKGSKNPFRVLLGFNPSHLESVNPVIMGVSRARQRAISNTQTRDRIIPLIIHGDAAFCGQGVVSETLQLSKLKGYTVGGTIHIIINNQIGFTTNPQDGRSSPYASDLAQSIQAPILLVNGDDVEACIRAMDIALRFRQEFKQDVIIDLICYRRFGHNEGDEPAFTQPLMYEVIKNHKTLRVLYKDQLVQSGVIQDDQDLSFKKHTEDLQKVLDKIRKKSPTITEQKIRGPFWPFCSKPSSEQLDESCPTSASKKDLDQVIQALSRLPSSFSPHPKVKRLVEGRKKILEAGQFDWALAELLAYGTLCLEGFPVRLSGQDSIRGTFSHRHASYFDIQNGQSFTPLSHLSPKQAEFIICNAPLSEMAVLGFEYGNSCLDHKTLTIWEAQFGDFSNGAQIIIDQYIASGEEKWLQPSSLTLFLPHGYEGQGPEHSSARLERFLQLCAQDNLQVCYPTTPANLFHVLRRQLKREFFKPLILMTPKSLLRHPRMISTTKEILEGGFKEIIVDEKSTKDPIRVLVLCSGKIYFELTQDPSFNKIPHALPIRVEQIYPFPKKDLNPYFSGLPQLEKIIWLQEEPRNMGAASFILPEIQNLLDEVGVQNVLIEYVGREEMASPAEGSSQIYQKEQNRIIQSTLAKVNI